MLTVAVQAGGRSSRMGSDKALLRLDGIPLIERLLQRVSGLGEEILITTNRPQDYQYLGLRMASDPEPGAGALHGLHTALEAARGQTVLVLACDMPFVSRPLLEHMLRLAEAADLVVPRRGGEYEPLHAVYSKGCLPALEAALQQGERRRNPHHHSFDCDSHSIPLFLRQTLLRDGSERPHHPQAPILQDERAIVVTVIGEIIRHGWAPVEA